MPDDDFAELVKLMAVLRSPQGCPWDREQTHDSIKGHLIEEAYEVIDAIEGDDPAGLKEELGDLLLQVVFHSQMASEAGYFSINDVIEAIVVKLRRRHPHIFGTTKADSVDEVLTQWEQIKADEKNRQSYLSGVPGGLPSLAQAQKLQEKAARVGFDWPDSRGVLDKLVEEISEFKACPRGGRERADEFGDILFTLVNLARHEGVDAELAVRRVSGKFRERFGKMEELAKAGGKDFAELSLDEQESLWLSAKEEIDDRH